MKKRLRLGWIVAAGLSAAGAAGAQLLVPYQNTRSINVADCTGTQCVVAFPAVPPKQRLVVNSISAQIGPDVSVIVLEGNGASYFVPKANPANRAMAAQVTVYFDPGSKPTARMFVPAGSQNTSLIVTLVGNLVPAQ